MYYFIASLAFFATTNSLLLAQPGRTRTISEFCEPFYKQHRYNDRYYNTYRNGDLVNDNEDLPDELLRQFVLQKALATASMREYLKAITRDEDVIDSRDEETKRYDRIAKKYDDIYAKERQESSRPSVKGRFGLEGTKVLRIEDVPRLDSVKTRYPSRIVDTDSKLRANHLGNRKLKRIIKNLSKAEEESGDSSDVDENSEEVSLIGYKEIVDSRDTNKNVNSNVNNIGGVKELPKSRISPKIIQPARSKYDPPPFVESRISQDRDEDRDGREDAVVVRENGKTDTDLADSLDPENNSTVENDDDLIQTRDVEEAISLTTRAPDELVVTTDPEINFTEVMSGSSDDRKKSRKSHMVRNRERLRRRKDKKRSGTRIHQQKSHAHSEQQVDNLTSSNKTESTVKSQQKLGDEVRGEKSKDIEPNTIVDEKNGELRNASASLEEVNDGDEERNKLKVQVPESYPERELSVDHNGGLVADVEPSLKVNANETSVENKRESEQETEKHEKELKETTISKGSRRFGKLTNSRSGRDKDREQNSNETLNRNPKDNRTSAPSVRHSRKGKNSLKYPQVEDSDLEEIEESMLRKRNRGRNSNSNVNKNNNVNRINSEPRLSNRRINSDSEVLRPRSKTGKITGKRNSKVKKNKDVSSIDGASRTPLLVDKDEIETHRRTNQNLNFNQNENRNVNTNVNRNKVRASGKLKFAHRDDFSDDDNANDANDNERIYEIITNRRNFNENYNKNENVNVNENNLGDDSNHRTYKIMSNRRTLEGTILDDSESDESGNVNRNVNKNINVNRNVNRLSNPHVRRRVQPGENVKLSQKAIESILQEVSQLRKQLAEKEGNVNGVNNREHRRALFHKGHNDMSYIEK